MNTNKESEALVAKWRWWHWLLAFVSLLVAATGMAMFFSRYWFIAEIINCYRLQIAVLIFVFAGIWFTLESRWLGLVFAGLAGVLIFPIMLTFMPASATSRSDDSPISLISFNVGGMNDDHQSTVKMFESSIPDLLIVLEYEVSWVEPLQVLEQSYGSYIKEPRSHGFGMAIFSRFPLNNPQVHLLSQDDMDCPFITAEVNAGEHPFIIAAAHFLAPMNRAKAEIRNRQIAEASDILMKLKNETGRPIVLAGDFNCVPWSSYLNPIKQGVDLFDSRRGFGFQGSWPTDFPVLLIPIDNVFASSNVLFSKRRILPALNSDHYPLYVEFVVDQQQTVQDARSTEQ